MAEKKDMDIDEKELQDSKGAEEAAKAAKEAEEVNTHDGEADETDPAVDEGSGSGEETKEDPADAGDEGDEEGEAPKEGKPDPRDKKIEELTDKYKRLFAEFDNYRKRTELEKAGMYDEGEKYVILRLLSVVDNFERAMASVPEELKGSSYVDGIDKIYRAFTDLLTELKVTPIDAAGKPFDANLHNAVMHVEDESVGENTVIEEFQKGYMYKDRVLRYSMVKVAN